MKLNRQIGYVKSEFNDTAVEIKEQNPSVIKIEDIPEIVKMKSKKIVDWINSHPAIKWSVICKNAGIDKGNFQRVLKSNTPIIKLENIIKLEKELKQYGYE